MREEGISTFFRSRIEIRICFGLGNIAGRPAGIFMCSSRVILAGISFWAALHFDWAGLARGVFRAWYLATPLPVGFLFGSE